MLNVHLTVLLFGTKELKAIKSTYCLAQKIQIVDQFMVEDYDYKGITPEKEAMACLYNMDIELPNYLSKTILTQLFFPDAYADKKRFCLECTSKI